MKRFLVLILSLVCILSFGGSATAVVIEWAQTAHSGNNYTLSFDVINNTLSSDIEWFSIYFGQTSDGLNFANTTAYSNFLPAWSGIEQPTGWFSYSFEPSSIDNPGQFNSDALSAGISNGNHVAGFTVSFDWSGVSGSSLDHLYFEVGNFSGTQYVFLADGYTTPAGPHVPEPATFALLGIGLVGMRFLRKMKSV